MQADNTPLESNIRGLVQPGDFPDAIFLFIVVAVFGDGHLHADPAAFLESGLRTVVVAVFKIYYLIYLIY